MICVIPYSFLQARINKHRSSGATEIVPWGEWTSCIFRPQSRWPKISAYGHRLAIGYSSLNITIYEFSPGFFKRPQYPVPKGHTTYGNHPWKDPETDTILTHRPPTTIYEFPVESSVTRVILEDDILGIATVGSRCANRLSVNLNTAISVGAGFSYLQSSVSHLPTQCAAS
ncbi:hypothetical protein BDN72DRAFT_134934 [Pluteus cervinus]|uniref:Uncharacterized protein n=1 Tax=Pluteus cervinus TaxID=181527 RepID=A0ACD3B870_9AGAR|nr:hypothetical protein BDN72DRAFT_134934 [Pluteus cervinus]